MLNRMLGVFQRRDFLSGQSTRNGEQGSEISSDNIISDTTETAATLNDCQDEQRDEQQDFEEEQGGDKRGLGGHDYKFLEITPDRLLCQICHFPSRDPYMSECCGHLFCKSCLDIAKKAVNISKACPVCRGEEFKTFCNKAIDREVRGLHIYCTNREKGCEWQGELNDISKHLKSSTGCQFEELKCPNECGKMIERQYLTSHVETECPRRKVNCQYCHDTGEHQFIEGQHKEECLKLPLPCPNKCEVGSVPREDVEAHRKKCSLEMIQCEYHNVGCEVKVARKDQEEHDQEEMKDHLMMTKRRLTELNDTQHQLMGTLIDTKDQLANAVKQLTNLTVLMNAQLSQNNNPMTPTGIRYIHLDSMATIFKFDDQTCPVTIKMSEYDVKKKNGEQWFSDSFYTHNKGYKMCLCVYAGGLKEGEGTHLSVYLHVMSGPHDYELAWPMKRNFVIKILNQITDASHYTMNIINDDRITVNKVSEDSKGKEHLGSPRFISNEDLCKGNEKYLKDDCLFFQVASY